MAVESQLCPQCGSAIKFAEGQSETVCTSCGTVVAKTTPDGASLEKQIENEKLIQEMRDRSVRLHTKGLPATARIISAQKTDIFANGLNGKGMLMAFTVEVQPDNEAPFNAETNTSVGLVALDKYQPGTVLDVRYDPKDHTQVSIEGRHGVPSSNPWTPTKEERKAQEQIRKGHEMMRKADEEFRRGEKEYQDADAEERGEAPLPERAKARKARRVVVPDKFNGVTDLGPAMAVYRNTGGGADLLAFVSQGEIKELVRYQDGIAYITRGKEVHTLRWTEVATIMTQISVHYPYYLSQRYTLVRSNGEKLIMDEFLEHMENLIELIKNKVYDRLYPPLEKQYDAGQAVTFGPVTIHRDHGLEMGGKTYPWDKKTEVKVDSGKLTVRTRDDKKHEVHTRDIPNVEMLCKLIGVKMDSYNLHE
jgi:ribosomal protein S27E